MIILFNQSDMVWVQTIVWYLLLSNVYTYFYYHLWCEDALLETFQTIHRVRRRFINLFVSVLFMMLCYVYFYSIMIPKHFALENSESNNIMISFIYAIAQSFAVDYEGMKPVSNIGATIEITQFLNMFIFISILLAKSLPKANQE